MAKRPAFFVNQGKVISELYSFEWYSGFAVSQKQKSVKSLHNAIIKADSNAKPLEISTKSTESIGIKLSAFNLKINNYTLENIFQSAKVFEHKSGSLKAFRYQNEDFPLIPQTVFYDFIYITAIKQSFTIDEVDAILSYNYFTDIEFNPTKSINTQARAVAMLKLIVDEYGYLPSFNKEDFIQYHKEHIFC